MVLKPARPGIADGEHHEAKDQDAEDNGGRLQPASAEGVSKGVALSFHPCTPGHQQNCHKDESALNGHHGTQNANAVDDRGLHDEVKGGVDFPDEFQVEPRIIQQGAQKAGADSQQHGDEMDEPCRFQSGAVGSLGSAGR
jgi:hypothetical protein